MTTDRDSIANDTLNEVYAELWSDTIALPRDKRLELLLWLSIAATLDKIDRRMGTVTWHLQGIVDRLDGRKEARTSSAKSPPANGQPPRKEE